MPALKFSTEAQRILDDLESDPSMSKKLKKVRKALGYLETNPRHQSLQTHKYQSIFGPRRVPLFDAYVENHTPSAWRIFFSWGPGEDEITIETIGPHP